MEEQEEFATALLQDSHDDLMARISKTRVVEDPSDNVLNNREDVESTGARAGGGGVDAATIVTKQCVQRSRDVCNAAGLLVDSVWGPQQR